MHTSNTSTEIKTHSRTLVEACSEHSQLWLLFLVKNALRLTQFLAPNHYNNNTIRSGSSSSQRSGAAKARRSKALVSPRVSLTWRLWGFVYSEEEECHIRLYSAMRCLGEDTHPPLTPTRPCNGRDLAQLQIKDIPLFPLFLSFQIYFTLAHWRFIISPVQTHGWRITHFKPHGVIYKARVTDKNHLWCLFWCVNSLL